jgi:hypothetical protein
MANGVILVRQGMRVIAFGMLYFDGRSTFLRWIGLRSDALTQGVKLEIALAPYGPDVFSTQYLDAAITRGNTGINSSFRIVQLSNLVLDAGTYWLTIHGRSATEQHTWLVAGITRCSNLVPTHTIHNS